MLKRLNPFGIWMVLILAWIPTQLVLGQGGIEVTQNLVDVQFPTGAVFSLKATSDVEIESVNLFYGTSGRSCQPGAARQAFQFDPANEVDLGWEWEWKRSGILPPGAEIWWQWEIKDTSGRTHLTENKAISVQDQRHDWQVIDQEDIVLQWYRGDENFGETLHSIATEGFERLSSDMGIRPEGQIWITIYPDGEELRETLIVSSEWTGGVAFIDHDSIFIAIRPGQLDWARSVIPHELAHLVVNALFHNCRGAFLPTWLNEGLAEFSEGPISPVERTTITKALEEGRLPALRSLARGFSAYGEDASLAYLQSALVVEFLFNEYGSERVLALLDNMKNGQTIDGALSAVYGFDSDGLDRTWRESLGFSPPAGEGGPSGLSQTPTPISTLPMIDVGLQPSATAGETTTPDPPVPTIEATKTRIPPTAPPEQPPPPTEPAGSVSGESTGLPTAIVWLVGAGGLLLLAGLLYLRFLRR